ncbi:MAG: aminopeptidase P N-terminal domain-containing protein, partial [Phycisphaerae bacterium]|nr:aminopeptidase P N-terminal domain-containing protein [Phycisphaerae bacterium]
MAKRTTKTKTTGTKRRQLSTGRGVASARASAPASARPPVHAQPSVSPSEFLARRERVLAELKGAMGVVLAGEADPSLHDAYRPHAHFEYLTGVTDEPGALLILDPTNPVSAKRATLLLRPLNPEVEKWDGFRHEMGAALRERTGVSTVMRTGMLARLLLEGAKRSRRLACLMPLAAYNAPVSADLEMFRRQSE